MIRSPLEREVNALREGKRLPDAVYLHRDAVPGLTPALRDAVEAAEAAAGRPAWDVVKFGRSAPVVSLLAYPEFWTDPFPGLRQSWRVDLSTGSVKTMVFRPGPSQWILHRKEEMLPSGHPARAALERLTRDLEQAGAFGHGLPPAQRRALLSRIGRRGTWDAHLARLGIAVESLMRRNPAFKEPPSGGSGKTSRKQVATVFKSVASMGGWRPGTVNVDIGGGAFDLATDYLAARGVENVVFDPENRTRAWNDRALARIRDGQADTATVANVLNVIRSPAIRGEVIALAANVLRPDGTAYFIVYENLGDGVGRKTRDGWQANRKTSTYMPEVRRWFSTVRLVGKVIVAKEPIL